MRISSLNKQKYTTNNHMVVKNKINETNSLLKLLFSRDSLAIKNFFVARIKMLYNPKFVESNFLTVTDIFLL